MFSIFIHDRSFVVSSPFCFMVQGLNSAQSCIYVAVACADVLYHVSLLSLTHDKSVRVTWAIRSKQ